MCGIAGIATIGRPLPVDCKNTVAAMVGTLVHRGPDEDGFWQGDGAAFGFRRLSIIDLDTGSQPMTSLSGNTIVLNGEIYNYRELRAELEAKGERFRTTSDTEVLLRLYDREGPDCLDRLNGMFAFAIFDARRRALFLARDRLGKKPLFIFQADGILAFASEIKALLTLPQVHASTEINLAALSDYLSFGYSLGRKTIFSGIESLPPAHALTVPLDGSPPSEREYWSTADIVNGDKRPYDAAARTDFQELLHDAVRLRLRSDVPLGGFLSGGIDSSAIVAMMSDEMTGSPETFSVGFREKSYDESKYAERVASHLGVSFRVLPQKEPDRDQLAKLVWHVDVPFADTSIMPTYTLNQAAREMVTVALSGDGGDEIFAGYPTYAADRYYGYYRHLPLALQRGLSGMADALLKPSYKKLSWDYKARQFLGAAGMTPRRAHAWWRTVFSESDKARILSSEARASLSGYDPYQTFETHFDAVSDADFLDQCLYVDQKTWLADDILVKADRMSMANSLEVRSPFMDHRLVEFMAGLSRQGKFSKGIQKVVLKDVMRTRLPEQTISRSKQGFNAPTSGLGAAVLDGGDEGALFMPDVRFDSAKQDVTYKSFTLNVLSIWLAMFSHYRRTGTWETI